MKVLITKNEKWTLVAFVLIFVLGTFLFSHSKVKEVKKECHLPKLEDKAERLVTKIIDGDTFLIEGGYPVRILGIDADEKGYPCAQEAQKRLEELILGKRVKLLKEKEDVDRFCRYLRYPFLGGENVAEKLLAEGLVVKRGGERFEKELSLAEERAKKGKLGCKWKEKTSETPVEIEACESEKFLNKEVVAKGKVFSTFKSQKGHLFLNLEKDYPHQCLKVMIFKSDLTKFPPEFEKNLKERLVKVKGKVIQYRGKPEIIVSQPDQIEIVE